MNYFAWILIIGQLCSLCLCEQDYTVSNEQIESFAGKYVTLADFSQLKTVTRARLFNGTMEFKEDMDDRFKLAVELYSSPAGDGDYKKMALDAPPTAICDAFKNLFTQFVQPSLELEKNTNFHVIPDDGLCPIPKGKYYLTNISFNTDSWPTQVPRGVVKAIVTFYKDEVNVGGATILVRIEDKDS